MNKKIPPDAFLQYYALGPQRTYAAIAERLGVSKRAVALAAQRENWQSQIIDLERNAREKSVRQAQETLEEINERHLKVLRYILGRAVDALTQAPPPRFGEASRAVLSAIEKERAILWGESERADTSVEELIRREYALCMRVVDVEPEPEPEDGAVEDVGGSDADPPGSPGADAS